MQGLLRRARGRWLVCALAFAAAAIPAPASAATHHIPSLSPANVVVDGPSADILRLNGMSIARDGEGGLVYLKDVDGVAHVFVSRLIGGHFGSPQQVDAGLTGASSQPVIAAGQGGVLIVAFVNGGDLYVSQALGASSALGGPTALFDGAANPALSLSPFGKGYLAFTATGATPDQVRIASFAQGAWTVTAGSLNANPATAAGDGEARPAVTCAGDGVGIVAWGEGGHIFTRRVVGTTLSTEVLAADPAILDGWSEVSAANPVISSGGDSSYASVTFQEELTDGAQRQSRVLMNHLHAGQYDGIFQSDGLTTGAPEGADQPQTAVTEFGAGWVTSEQEDSHGLYGAVLGPNAAAKGVQRIDSSANSSAPDAVPATAGVVSTLIAWQQSPGIGGPAEIRIRYAPNGSDLGPEQVVSSPALGAVDADHGLVAAGDVAGDAAVAWIQGTGADTQVVTAQLYQAPGSFVPKWTFRYATSANPVLSWSNAAESWGAAHYSVVFDGAPLTQTYSPLIRTPMALSNGRHTWDVSATNAAGLTSAARAATVFVDTVHPRVKVKLRGRRIVGARQTIVVTRSDPPPPGSPPNVASGMAKTQVRWGDGVTSVGGRSSNHVYRRAKTYTITVTGTDRAGNRTVVTRKLTIRKAVASGSRARRRGSKHPRRRLDGLVYKWAIGR